MEVFERIAVKGKGGLTAFLWKKWGVGEWESHFQRPGSLSFVDL